MTTAKSKPVALVALQPIRHNGRRFAEGKPFQVADEHQAQQLLACGAARQASEDEAKAAAAAAAADAKAKAAEADAEKGAQS